MEPQWSSRLGTHVYSITPNAASYLDFMVYEEKAIWSSIGMPWKNYFPPDFSRFVSMPTEFVAGFGPTIPLQRTLEKMPKLIPANNGLREAANDTTAPITGDLLHSFPQAGCGASRSAGVIIPPASHFTAGLRLRQPALNRIARSRKSRTIWSPDDAEGLGTNRGRDWDSPAGGA